MRTRSLVLTLLALAPFPAAAQSLDTLAFGALTWRSLGPLRGGRSVAAAGSVARPAEWNPAGGEASGTARG